MWLKNDPLTGGDGVLHLGGGLIYENWLVDYPPESCGIFPNTNESWVEPGNLVHTLEMSRSDRQTT